MKKIVSLILSALMMISAFSACATNSKSPIPKQYLIEGDLEMLDLNIVKDTYTSSDDGDGNYSNPVIYSDVPDIDIIRVDDA